MMKTLAIIPARGGSKRVPHKNIKLLNGKPLVIYTIEAALRSKRISDIILSTDDYEIAKIALGVGLSDTIIRPTELATDEASVIPVLEHAVTTFEKNHKKIQTAVLLNPTSPLRTSAHIDEALRFFENGGFDSVLSFCQSPDFIWRKSNMMIYPLNYDIMHRPRKQDYFPSYKENGAIYIAKRDFLMKYHNFLGGLIGSYVMPLEYSFEVDTPFDFWLCEQIIKDKEYVEQIRVPIRPAGYRQR